MWGGEVAGDDSQLITGGSRACGRRRAATNDFSKSRETGVRRTNHHGSEELLASSSNEGVGCAIVSEQFSWTRRERRRTSRLERLSDVVSSLGDESDLLHRPDRVLGDDLSEPGHAPAVGQ